MKRFIQDYGVVVAFVALCVATAIWQPDLFLQPENLRNLVNQNAAVGIVAIGMTLVIVTGGIDLSVGSLMALCASLGILSLNKALAAGASESVAVVAAAGVALVAGLSLGLVNGLFVTLGRLAPFIVTLCGLVAYRSLALALAEGGEIRSASTGAFPSLGSGGLPLPFVQGGGGHELIITWSMLLFFTLAVVMHFVLTRTRYGRHAVATGANERAARYSAINTNRVKLIAYAAMGLIAAVSSVGLAARMNSVTTSQLGQFYELDAIAAVVIGGTSMSGGRGRVWGTVIGVLILAVINNMLVASGVSAYWQGFVKGAIILVAVLIGRGRTD